MFKYTQNVKKTMLDNIPRNADRLN